MSTRSTKKTTWSSSTTLTTRLYPLRWTLTRTGPVGTPNVPSGQQHHWNATLGTWGHMVTGIGGIEADASWYWSLYVERDRRPLGRQSGWHR